MVEVGVDDFGAPVPQAEGGGLLPLVGEPVHVDQLGGVVAVVDEQRERAAGIDGLELRVVADQQHLRPSLGREVRDAVQGQGAGEGGFVHDDELASAERVSVDEVVLPPLRGVLGRDSQIIGEDLRRDRGRREPDHAAGAMLVLPRPPQRGHGRSLPRPSRANEDIDDAPGHGDLRQRGSLVVAESVSLSVRARGDPLDHRERHGRPGGRAGAVNEAVFGRQQSFGGEHCRVLRPEHRCTVRSPEHDGTRRKLRRGESQGGGLGGVHDQPDDRLSIHG